MAKGRNTAADDDSDIEEVPQNGADGDSEGEEYEIEAILDAKPGIFEEGKYGYLVKWKGYGEDQNSWVAQEDASNANDLIDLYWQKHKKGKPAATGRKSDVKPAAPQKRKSSEDAAETASVPSKKRGRPPKAKSAEPVDESDDEPVAKPVKKGRKSAADKPAPRRGRASDAMDMDEDEPEETYASMKKWKALDSWEHLVDRIDTVEQTEDGILWVYFRLKPKDGSVLCREDAKLCREKMPNLLFDFYESNLRWRPFDG